MDKSKNLIWIDLEMTGLNPDKDVILEIASVITDSQLNIISSGLEFVIHQPQEMLDHMNDDIKKMHKKSGLLAEVAKSMVTIDHAEKETLQFFKKYCKPNTALLSGNSVWQDKNFLSKYMPSLVDFCYYRILDITAIKEVVARWYPKSQHSKIEKEDKHRAMPDVLESIAELKHFRKYFFVK